MYNNLKDRYLSQSANGADWNVGDNREFTTCFDNNSEIAKDEYNIYTMDDPSLTMTSSMAPTVSRTSVSIAKREKGKERVERSIDSTNASSRIYDRLYQDAANRHMKGEERRYASI
jgi:hypothetical protein